MRFEFIKDLIEGVKKLDTEVNEYKKVVKNPYMPSIAYVNWAMHLVESGDVQSAEEKLVSSTLMAHQTPESYIALGIIKTKEKKFEEAKNLYIKALNIDNNNAKAYCFLGNVLTEMGEYQEAEEKFEYAIKLNPNNSDIMLNWGISLVRQKKFLLAKEKFKKAYKFDKSNFAILYFLGLVNIELGEMEQAKGKFKLLTSAIPTHFEAFYYLAYINYKLGLYKESLSDALKSLEIFDKKLETYMLIAENYMNLENKDECLKYYEIGKQNCIPNYYFMISWGLSLQHFVQYEESKLKFKCAIDMNDKNDLGFVSLGVSFMKLNDYDEAISLFNQTLQLNPSNITALDGLGQICFDRQNYDEAIKYFDSILKISAKAVNNYSRIAQAYSFKKDFSQADIYFKKAVEYQPDEISVYIDYAKSLMERNEYQNALKKLQNAYKLDSKNLECLNLLFYVNYILAKENRSDYNVEKAVKIAEEIEQNYPNQFKYIEEKKELESKSNSID